MECIVGETSRGQTEFSNDGGQPLAVVSIDHPGSDLHTTFEVLGHATRRFSHVYCVAGLSSQLEQLLCPRRPGKWDWVCWRLSRTSKAIVRISSESEIASLRTSVRRQRCSTAECAHLLELFSGGKVEESSPRLRSIGKLIIANKLSLGVEGTALGYPVRQSVLLVDRVMVKENRES